MPDRVKPSPARRDRYPEPMRRWLILALAPTGVLAANALVALSGGVPTGPSFGIGAGRLLALGLLVLEVIGLAWVGGALLRTWTAARHEQWTLPIGIAAGFLPWVLLLESAAERAVTVAAITGWAIASIGLGAVVTLVRTRAAVAKATSWTAVAGGALLVLIVPFLAVRALLGPALAPWSAAPLLSPATVLGATFGPAGL